MMESNMRWLYDSVMDPDVNPLQKLPPAQRYQIMIYLSLVWTVAFCSTLGEWYLFGYLAFAHILMAGAAFITGWTFHRVQRDGVLFVKRSTDPINGMRTYRDHPRNDGTARYDDVWGG